MRRWRRLMGMKQILVMMVVVVGCSKDTPKTSQAVETEAQVTFETEPVLPVDEKVDATEQFELGVMYYKGELVRTDKKKALEFFQLAADQKHAMARALIKTTRKQ